MSATAPKGLVLAAGLGTRLRPLTDYWPKPLLPFCGTTPLALALNRLRQAGIADIAVNTHHLASQIEAALAGSSADRAVRISHEPEILGTGGVYNPLREWQGQSDLVVINGDVVSDVDLASAMRTHASTGAVATMVLLPEVLPGESAVFFRGDQLLAIGREPPAPSDEHLRRGNFACVQILSRGFVELLPTAGQFDIIAAGYQVALRRGLRLSVVVHRGLWHDIGSPKRYAAAVFGSLEAPDALPALGIAERRFAVIGGSADKLSVIESGGIVEGGASVERCIVLPGGIVRSRERLRGVIVAPNGRVPID